MQELKPTQEGGGHPVGQALPSSRRKSVVFLPRGLEATHSAPVSTSSGVTRTLRRLRTLCGSGSCSLAYEEEEQRLRAGREDRSPEPTRQDAAHPAAHAPGDGGPRVPRGLTGQVQQRVLPHPHLPLLQRHPRGACGAGRLSHTAGPPHTHPTGRAAGRAGEAFCAARACNTPGAAASRPLSVQGPHRKRPR